MGRPPGVKRTCRPTPTTAGRAATAASAVPVREGPASLSRSSPIRTIRGILAVDDSAVYWIVAGTPAGNFDDGAVLRASKSDGSMVTTVASSFKNPWSIATDDTSVYWTVQGDDAAVGTVSSVPKSLASPPKVLAMGLVEPGGLALDATRAYWAEGTGAGLVQSVAIDGSSPPATVATVAGGASALLVDSQYVYFNASPRDPDSGTSSGISRVAKAGGTPAPLTDTALYVASMAFDGSRIIYAAATTPGGTGGIYSVPSAGGPAAVLVSGVDVRALIVDDTSIFWVDGHGVGSGAATGSVWKMPKAGGAAPVALAGSQPGPSVIRGDATAIYWINYGPATATPYLFTGAVMKLAK